MPRNLTGPAGQAIHLPFVTTGRAANGVMDTRDNPIGINKRLIYDYFEDFDWDSFDFNEHPLAYFEAPAGGGMQAASGLVADAPFGQYLFKLASTSEAETFGFSWGDNRFIPANSLWYFEARVKVSAITTNQRVILGMAHDFNATLDNITLNAWFRLEASMVLRTELDDNTLDTDDYVGDDTQTLTADTFYIFSIENGIDGYCHYRLANGDGQYEREFAKIASTGFDTTTLQPMLGVQKASGATQPNFTCDYVRVACARV